MVEKWQIKPDVAGATFMAEPYPHFEKSQGGAITCEAMEDIWTPAIGQHDLSLRAHFGEGAKAIFCLS